MARLPQIAPSGLTSGANLQRSAGIEGRAAAQAFRALSEAAGEMRQQLQPILEQRTQDQAAEDVAEAFENREDENSLPNIERRRVWSRVDAVYNNAVEAGMVARAQVDLEEAAIRMREEHRFDPDGYEQASNAFIRQYLGEDADEPTFSPAMSQQIELAARQRFNRDGAVISDQARQRDIAEAQESLELRLAQLSEEQSTGISEFGADFTVTPEYAETQGEIQGVISQLVEHPGFGWSAERGAQALEAFVVDGRESLLEHEVRSVFANDGYEAAINFIQESTAEIEMDNSARTGMRGRLTGIVNAQVTMENVAAGARRDAETALEDQRKAAADRWEAAMLSMRVGGVLPPEEMVQAGLRHVANGSLTRADFEAVFTVNDPAETDERHTEIAALMDLARNPATSREELNGAMAEAMRVNRLTWETRERILGEFDTARDDRVRVPEDYLRAFYSQGMFDRYANVDVMKEEAVIELRRWLEANPEATRVDAMAYARSLAEQHSREIPAPLLGLGIPAYRQDRYDDLEAWYRDALMSVEDQYGDDPDSQDEAYERIEAYAEWQRAQLVTGSER